VSAASARVVKFGGSIIGSGARIAEAARTVARTPAGFTVVVASAPGDLTDRTLDVLTESALPTEGIDAARVLARAEHLGAELMASALRARHVPARVLLPGDSDWPVVLTAPGSNASVDLPATRARFLRLRSRSPDGAVWVLPGFVGVDANGQLGTLPRGGGDTTAVIAAVSLDARVVFLVKDVAGVLEADPRVDPTARTIPELSREHMERMARAGAGVVALDALRYLPPGLDLHVVGLGAPLDGSTGTVVRAGPAARSRGSSDTVTARAPVPRAA
jgi:aspartate kinase